MAHGFQESDPQAFEATRKQEQIGCVEKTTDVVAEAQEEHDICDPDRSGLLPKFCYRRTASDNREVEGKPLANFRERPDNIAMTLLLVKESTNCDSQERARFKAKLPSDFRADARYIPRCV